MLKWRRVVREKEHAILDRTDKVAVLHARHALDLLPFLVSQELLPGCIHRPFIWPGKQINEFGTLRIASLPHGDDLETMLPHDPHSMVTEAGVKRRFVVLEDLIDS